MERFPRMNLCKSQIHVMKYVCLLNALHQAAPALQSGGAHQQHRAVPRHVSQIHRRPQGNALHISHLPSRKLQANPIQAFWSELALRDFAFKFEGDAHTFKHVMRYNFNM